MSDGFERLFRSFLELVEKPKPSCVQQIHSHDKRKYVCEWCIFCIFLNVNSVFWQRHNISFTLFVWISSVVYMQHVLHETWRGWSNLLTEVSYKQTTHAKQLLFFYKGIHLRIIFGIAKGHRKLFMLPLTLIIPDTCSCNLLCTNSTDVPQNWNKGRFCWNWFSSNLLNINCYKIWLCAFLKSSYGSQYRKMMKFKVKKSKNVFILYNFIM